MITTRAEVQQQSVQQNINLLETVQFFQTTKLDVRKYNRGQNDYKQEKTEDTYYKLENNNQTYLDED
eukprot:TRINITY_DN7457_c0_g1_i1.p1 TRINITY_DN7457_c0_g1~~TRINITY_DN7457_c0_g1_i1.p1  ORF type:complete len:67 (-),score=8.14 TRINITY_DN7457_c0_g1_i1:261-461(-)